MLLGVKDLTNKTPPYTNANQGNFAAGYNALIVDPTLTKSIRKPRLARGFFWACCGFC